MKNISNFISKNKTAIAIILVIIVVAVIFYRKGKKQTTAADLPLDTPGGGNNSTGNGGVNLSGNQLSSNQIVLYADQVFDDIDCVFCTRNAKLYADLAIVSDTDLVKIYNAYNAKYQTKHGETMLQALKAEYFSLFTGDQNFDAVIARLQKYNLK